MKHSRIWVTAVLLILLCVGTALALHFSRSGSGSGGPGGTEAQQVSGEQPVGDAPALSETARPSAGQGGGEDMTETAVPTPTESGAPTERDAPAPTGSGAPRDSNAPTGSDAPTPAESGALTPTETGALTPTDSQTPAPSATAAPTAPSTQRPGVTEPPKVTASPSPTPTVPVSPGRVDQDAARIDELYAGLNALRSEAVSRLAALADQAEAEWLSIRDRHPSRKNFIMKYYDQGAELEASYDAQVDALCNELQYLLSKTGGDVAAVRQIRAEYEAEKESARSAYYQRFMTLLDLL